MPKTLERITKEVLTLPAPERIRVAQAILESISKEPNYTPLTGHQKAILDARIAEDEANPYGGITLEQLEGSLATVRKSAKK